MKIAEILEQLRQPVPSNLISPKTVKGKKSNYTADYIAWFDICDLLDQKCGISNWSWEVKDIQQIGARLTLIGVLTIYGEDRSLTMMATGSEDIDCSSYGDPSSNAEASAIRRCASKLGLARNLWRKDKPINPYHHQSKSPKYKVEEPKKKGWMTPDEFKAMQQAKAN